MNTMHSTQEWDREPTGVTADNALDMLATDQPLTPPAKPADRPASYPTVGQHLQHAHCNETGTVVANDPHSDARKTRQRAITIRTGNGAIRVFEMSVGTFWFNWKPAA